MHPYRLLRPVWLCRLLLGLAGLAALTPEAARAQTVSTTIDASNQGWGEIRAVAGVPSGNAVHPEGTLFVADAEGKIWKVSPQGFSSAFASWNIYWGGSGYYARPLGIAVAPDGDVYISRDDHIIVRIVPNVDYSATDPVLRGEVIAGSRANWGTTDGIGSDARFDRPYNLVVGPSNVLYVTDYVNKRIRKIVPNASKTQWTVSTLAGLVPNTEFADPHGIAISKDGNYLYVTDSHHYTIKRIATLGGAVTTIAGNGTSSYADGVGTAAAFRYPTGIAVDNNDVLYVTDTDANRIRKIVPDASRTNWTVSTLAGSINGTAGYVNGIGTNAQFMVPYSVYAKPDGSLINVLERDNRRIRRIDLPMVTALTAYVTPNGAQLQAVPSYKSFDLVVTGSGFDASASRVVINGTTFTPQFNNSTSLRVTGVSTSVFPASGDIPVRVDQVSPGNGQSSTLSLPVVRPSISGVSPQVATRGGAAFTLTVTGQNFVSGLSQVYWNGQVRTTTFVNATTLTAAIPASDLTTAGSPVITVRNNIAESPASVNVYVIEPPASVSASDGTYDGYIKVVWTDNATNEDGYNVYRDGTLVATVGSNSTSFDDSAPAVLPGVGHTYSVATKKGLFESSRITDIGWRLANGSVTGRISAATPTGPGVGNVDVSLNPTAGALGSVLDLNGTNGYAQLPAGNYFTGGDYTVETWVNIRSVTNYARLLDFGNSPATNNVIMSFNATGGKIEWTVYTAAYTFTSVTTPTALPLNQWVHLAFVYSGTTATIYKDGTVWASGALSVPANTNRATNYFGKSNWASDGYLNGRMDEVRIWSVARTAAEMAADRNRILTGTETGLTSYYRFDEAAGTVAMDHAVRTAPTTVAAHGTLTGGATLTATTQPSVRYRTLTANNGSYVIPNVTYSRPSITSTTFDIVPALTDNGTVHTFQPSTLSATLNSSLSSATAKDFIDNSTLAVSGRVSYANLTCNAAGVTILVDGVAKTTTAADGTYSVSVIAGPHTIQAQFNDSQFLYTGTTGPSTPANTATVPGTYTAGFTAAATGINFTNQTTHVLTLRFRGACDAIIGTATFRVLSKSGSCVDQTVTTNAAGIATLTLAPQDYTITLVGTNPVNPAILSYFGPGAVETSVAAKDSTTSFIYRAPPEITISGLPSPTLGLGVPVLPQDGQYPITITVRDGGQSCTVQSGRVRIEDQTGNVRRDTTITLKDGVATYLVTPGFPNISAPYRKALSITAIVEGQPDVNLQQLVVVTGLKPRGETFTTTTAQLPLMVLRDPPGDKSFSFLSKGTSYRTNISASVDKGADVKVSASLQLGSGISIFGVRIAGVYVKVGGGVQIGGSRVDRDETALSITALEDFSTADDDAVVGDDGDVFMGAAMNLTYGLTDELKIVGGAVKIDTTLVMAPNGFDSQYLYTAYHIKTVVIPELEMLIANPETDADRKMLFRNSVYVWQQVLANNEAQKLAATQVVNRSYSGGANYRYSLTTERTKTTTIDTKVFINHNVSVEAGVDVGEYNKLVAGVEVNGKFEFGGSNSTTTGTSNTIGYSLGDNDPGDVFSVDVKSDAVYGTPVFKLVSGKSSAPWEPGTLNRDRPTLTATPLAQVDVPADQPAVFNLIIGNQSPSGEARAIVLAMRQDSNPNGAIVKVNGSSLTGVVSYYLNPGETRTVTVTVERGPVAYDYPNLQLIVRTPYDSDLLSLGYPPQIGDTATVSVSFKRPCSPIALFRPEANWLVSGTDSNLLSVIMNGFDPNDVNLQSVTLQYRKQGTATWLPARIISRDSLNKAQSFVAFNWNVTGLGDGGYELRAFAQCSPANKYTATAAFVGRIDRKAPVAFGQPQPADGVLGSADDISITFNEPIDDNALFPTNTVLTVQGTGENVPVEAVTNGTTLVLIPLTSDDQIEGKTLVATVSGIKDLAGNPMAAPVSWTFVARRGSASQQLALANGWTWFSLNVRPDNLTLNTVLAGLSSASGDIVRAQSSYAQFAPGSGWVGPLASFAPGTGYQTKRSGVGTLTLSGPAVDPSATPIPLVAGWNWIGFLPQSPMTVNAALASFAAQTDDVIKSQFGYAQYLAGSGWFGSLGFLQPGQSYLLKVANAGTLTYPGGVAGRLVAAVGASEADRRRALREDYLARVAADSAAAQAHVIAPVVAGAPSWSVQPQAFPGSMTITATVRLADGSAAGPADLVAAFVGGECRGVAQPVAVPGRTDAVVFLLVHGGATPGETVTFQAYSAGRAAVDALPQAVAFRTDGALGSLSNPVQIGVGVTDVAPDPATAPTAFTLAQNSPNPFNPTTTISYQLAATGRVRLDVFDALGRPVRVLVDEIRPAGAYTATFDGAGLATGLYVYRLTAGSFTATRRMMLVK